MLTDWQWAIKIGIINVMMLQKQTSWCYKADIIISWCYKNEYHGDILNYALFLIGR